MTDFAERIAPGTVVQWIVGMPGPDCDQALVTECLGPGEHKVKFKVWGQDEWHEAVTRARLWIEPNWPGQWNEQTADMLRGEWDRMQQAQPCPPHTGATT